MTFCTRYLAGGLTVLFLVGCAAKGDVVPINLIPVVQTSTAKPDALVVIKPFEDTRPEGGRLGTRAHFWAANHISRFRAVRRVMRSRRPCMTI